MNPWLAAAGRLTLSDGENRFLQEIGGQVLRVEVTAEDGRPQAIAMEQELKFAIREGGRTVGAGRVTKILK